MSGAAQHMALHPRLKTIPFAGNAIPTLIESVVAFVVTVRVGGIRTARTMHHGGHHPMRQHDGVHRRR